MAEGDKPIHVKPSYYAWIFYDLKEIAKKYGYNLVLHGSMNRDLDLVAIPWEKELRPHSEMIQEFCQKIEGQILKMYNGKEDVNYSTTYHGRMHYVIDIRRFNIENKVDLQYYIDISVIPVNSISRISL